LRDRSDLFLLIAWPQIHLGLQDDSETPTFFATKRGESAGKPLCWGQSATYLHHQM